MIQPSEVIEIALARNISEELIRDRDIEAAQIDYVKKYVGTDLYDLLVANADNDYDDFIADYVKPVLAYGVVYNIFDRITAEVSDRGVVAMLSEGATVMDAESRLRAKQEYLSALVVYLEKMTDYLGDSEDALFEDYEDQEYEYGFQPYNHLNRNSL
jgi:hypothetical protein